MRLLIDLADYLLFFFTTSILSLGFLKYTFYKEFQYPYLALLVFSLPLALIGFVQIMKQLYRFNGRNQLFYLFTWQYIIIAVLFTTSYILAIASLIYQNMSIIRFAVVSHATEVVIMPFLCSLILQRDLFGHYILAIVMAIGGYLVHDIAMVERKSLSKDESELVTSVCQGWQGPVLCLLSKLFYLLATVLSKRFILTRAYFNKIKDEFLFQQADSNKGGGARLPTQQQNEQSQLNNTQSPLKAGQVNTNNEFLEANNGGSVNNQPYQHERKMQSFYKDYFEGGEDKPKLLKKTSFLFKRFELIKKLDQDYENLAIEATRKGDPSLENKLETFKRLLGESTTVHMRDIGKAPKPLQTAKPKLQLYVDYGALDENEMDQIMNLDENYINDLIKKQKEVRLEDLKKWEFQVIIQREEEERRSLELFLHDYKNIKLNAHFFHDKDDLSLTKLDLVFDSLVYDAELLNIDMMGNLELYGVCGLLLSCVSLFAAFYNREFYRSLYELVETPATQVSVYEFGQSSLYVMFIIAGLLIVGKPLIIARMVMNHSKGVYFMLRIVTDYFVVLLASLFTELLPILRVNQLIALGLVAFAQFLIYNGAEHKRKWTEFISLLELAKSYFAHELEVDQLVLMEVRLIQAHYMLGRDEFLRLLIDLLASGNPRQLLHTANPTLFLRQYFDPLYTQRCKDWGGSYPRPLVESIESSWISSDHRDIWISQINKTQQQFLQQQQLQQQQQPQQLINNINSQINNSQQIQTSQYVSQQVLNNGGKVLKKDQ